MSETTLGQLQKAQAQLPQAPTDAQKGLESLGAGVAGGLNALAFGLPEAAIKALWPDAKRIVDEYKARNKDAYGTGETLGTVGSMFIPGGAIARFSGLGAKALGLGKLAGGLGKVADVAGRAPGFTQGLAAAAEQAVPRAVAGAMEGEDLGKNALETGGALALGGGVGAGLAGLGRLAKHIPKRPLEEIDEMANAQILSPIFGKSLTRAIRSVTKNKGPSTQIEEIDNIMGRMVKKLDDHDIHTTQQAEDLLSENGRAWKQVEDSANDAIATGKMENIGNLPADLLQSPDVAYALTRWGTKADEAMKDIAGQIKRTTKDPMSVFSQTRSILNDEIETGFKATTPEGKIRGQVATAMKNHFDKSAMDKAPNAPDLKALKEIYPAFLVMGRALAREKGVIAPAFTPGSKTFASFMSSNILDDPGVAIKAGASSLLGGVMEKVSPMIGNVVGSEVARGVKNALPRQIPGDILSAPKEITLPPALQAMLGASGKVGVAGAERAGMIPQAVSNGIVSDQDTNQASLTGEPKVPMMQPIPIDSTTIPTVAGTAPDPIAKGLETAWLMQDPQGIIEESQPGSKEAFMNAVRERLNGPDGTPDLRKAGKVIFAGQPDKAKAFTEAYDAFDKIQKGLPDAVKGALTGFDQKAELNKQVVKDTVVGLLKKGDGMDAKLAEGKVDGILNSLDAPAVKSAKILALIQAYDKRFAPGGVLESAGISLRGTE